MALTQITGTGIGSVDSLTPTTIYLGGSGSANALDDYEEGTWTPSVGGTATYTHSEGFYTKIGNLVHIHFDIQINAIGTGNGSSITNAPFTSANLPNVATGYPISIAYHGTLANTATWIVGYVADSGTSISFAGNNTAATTIQLNGFVVFQNGARIIGSGTYRTA